MAAGMGWLQSHTVRMGWVGGWGSFDAVELGDY